MKSAGSDKELVLQPDGITGPGICMCKGRREAEIPRPEKVMTLVSSPPYHAADRIQGSNNIYPGSKHHVTYPAPGP